MASEKIWLNKRIAGCERTIAQERGWRKAAEANLAALEEACRPFAEAPDDQSVHDDALLDDYEGLTVGNLRRLQSVLATLQSHQEGE